jgi:pyroglutamyl-peptidase
VCAYIDSDPASRLEETFYRSKIEQETFLELGAVGRSFCILMLALGTTVAVTEGPTLILTGFGPFGDVTDNPTSILIQELRRRILCEALPVKVKIFSVLEVSTVGVDSFLQSVSDVRGDRVCIHLGVDSAGQHFKLERSAYNNTSFRIPDATGAQPNACKIVDEFEFDEPLESKFDLDSALTQLQDEGFDVKSSDDPGRYLCNYVFYKSQYCAPESPVVFIHVPPFSVYPMEQQAAFVSRAVEILTAQALESRGKR